MRKKGEGRNVKVALHRRSITLHRLTLYLSVYLSTPSPILASSSGTRSGSVGLLLEVVLGDRVNEDCVWVCLLVVEFDALVPIVSCSVREQIEVRREGGGGDG